ncbi:unnamed protein product, partial [Laminaria digitata]
MLHRRLVGQRRALWEEIENKMLNLLSGASVSGGALELEDLAGVVGAVGLLATLADEFVGAEETTPPGELGESASGAGKPRESGLVVSD